MVFGKSRNETADEKKARLNEKTTLTLTAQEVFVLQCALERYVDIDDSEFVKSGKIGEKIQKRLPKVDVDWNDVASRSRY